jgi:hypothetical protein
MFQAIGSPGDRLKSLRVNLLAINHTSAERTVFDALDSVWHLLQHRPVDFSFRELLLFEFVVDALVAHFNGGPIDNLHGRFDHSIETIREFPFHRKQSLSGN